MKVCVRCIYSDEIIPGISFDDNGICNYCHQHDELDKEYPTGEGGLNKIHSMVREIKEAGKGKKYDVVIGVSGGCDSSYLLHMAKEFGLRPLAAHFDNTWNSKIAVENIKIMLEELDIDLYTHVVDHEEYDEIFKSFLKASVPDADVPTDLALAATHYMAAEKFGIKYIWEGHSYRTEGIAPYGWSYMDARYIKSVQEQFGTKKIKTLPLLTLARWFKWMIFSGIKKIRPLYYLDYDKEKVKKMLHEKYKWQWYGGHHMENRTAYFLNNYYQPKKFNIDLRYSELSALIRSKQMDREEALEIIKIEKPFDKSILEEIKKRLSITDKEFLEIMSAENKDHRQYKTYKKLFEYSWPLFFILYKLDLVPKSFYLKYTRKYDKSEVIDNSKEIKKYFSHETAIIDNGAIIGNGTKIWHWVHICNGAEIGENCILGQNVYVGPGTKIGNNVKVQNNVSIYEGITIEDNVFLGPSCVLTNDRVPSAVGKWELTTTLIKEGASIGANVTIVCGNTIGKNSLIGAGSVVITDVPDNTLFVGNPARFKKYRR
jgi:N-acetyl sugar amidotransferase